MSVLSKCLKDYGIFWKSSAQYVCTCKIARKLNLNLPNNKLNTLCDYFSIELDHHNAMSDARAAAKLIIEFEKRSSSLEKFASTCVFN
jgi:DNA polymerase-3 subunit epsilon